jgi:hypothetical protein
MPVPGERHKNVRTDKHQNRPETLHINIVLKEMLYQETADCKCQAHKRFVGDKFHSLRHGHSNAASGGIEEGAVGQMVQHRAGGVHQCGAADRHASLS